MKLFSAQSYFEQQYVLRQTLPTFQEHVTEWEQLSSDQDFSENWSCVEQYGEHPRQSYELFKVEQGKPAKGLAVFIHGGFWRAMSREQFRFVAKPFLANGYDCVIAEYRLMPEFRLEELVQDTANMLIDLGKLSEKYSLSNNIILSGHSAGAHLAVFGLQRARQSGHSLDKCCLLLFSGVFDIFPVSKTSIGDELQMSDAEIKRWSVYEGALDLGVDSLFVVGDSETEDFKRQSIVGSQFLSKHGANNITYVAGANHLTLMTKFAMDESLAHECLQRLDISKG